jgi:hypothetical protein
VSRLTEGKETVKGKNLQPRISFIGEGERDDVEPGPPISNGEPVVRELAELWCGCRETGRLH